MRERYIQVLQRWRVKMDPLGENVTALVHAVLDEVEPAAHVSYDTGEDMIA
jgi:hypothetical protein